MKTPKILDAVTDIKKPAREKASTEAPQDRKGRIMTADDFRSAISQLGLKITSSRHVFGYSGRQAQRYARGDKIPAPLRKLLLLMIKYNISASEVKSIDYE